MRSHTRKAWLTGIGTSSHAQITILDRVIRVVCASRCTEYPENGRGRWVDDWVSNPDAGR